MIYLTAVNDVGEGSSFDTTVRKMTLQFNQPAWGISELSEAVFNRIKRADHVLFYNRKKIIGVGHVDNTMVDRELSESLWGTFQHRFKGTLHWSGIIVFREFVDIDVPFEVMRELGGYDKKFAIRRTIPFNEVGQKAIQMKFNGEDAFIQHLVSAYAVH